MEPTDADVQPSARRPAPPWSPHPVALVGPGRAGRAVAAGLRAAGAEIVAVAGRDVATPSVRSAAHALGAEAASVEAAVRAADVVVVAVPDDRIRTVAARVRPALRPDALVLHCSGVHPPDVLAGAEPRSGTGEPPPRRTGALHPLVSIPDRERGAERLAGAWCAVAGDPEVRELALALAMRPFELADEQRARYHAAACVAANHVVALLGHLERLAESADVPIEAYLPLARAAVDNSEALGPTAALTGPVARGDRATVATHLATVPPEERAAYRALAREALRLRGDDDPALEALLAGDDAVTDRASTRTPSVVGA